ncbi:MAG: hypothetical protein WAK40_02575 [Thermoplasmata archaeon]
MSSALVVAARGTGLSTFLGLLYTAEVRLGSERADEFRFHVDRDSIRRLEGIYGELGDGRFPESEVDWGRTPLTFLFGFKRSGLRRVLPRGATPDLEFRPFRVEIGGLATEEVAELSGSDAVLESTTRRLLASRILMPIVDATTIPDEAGVSDRRITLEDRHLARTLDLVLRFVSAERDRRARRLFPLFVMTKSDLLSEAAAHRLGAPRGPPPSWSPEARAAFGARVLSELLPETARVLSEGRRRRVEIAPPTWFYSEVVTEERSGFRIRRRWKSPVGGWEPEYPFEEYHALLDRLGDIAYRLPDSPELEA